MQFVACAGRAANGGTPATVARMRAVRKPSLNLVALRMKLFSLQETRRLAAARHGRQCELSWFSRHPGSEIQGSPPEIRYGPLEGRSGPRLGPSRPPLLHPGPLEGHTAPSEFHNGPLLPSMRPPLTRHGPLFARFRPLDPRSGPLEGQSARTKGADEIPEGRDARTKGSAGPLKGRAIPGIPPSRSREGVLDPAVPRSATPRAEASIRKKRTQSPSGMGNQRRAWKLVRCSVWLFRRLPAAELMILNRWVIRV